MRTVIIPAKEMVEGIHAYTHDIGNKRVTVAVGLGNMVDEEMVFEEQSYDTISLAGQDYADLMSEDGAGLLPGKAAGHFRKDDLWPFIDRARAKKVKP